MPTVIIDGMAYFPANALPTPPPRAIDALQTQIDDVDAALVGRPTSSPNTKRVASIQRLRREADRVPNLVGLLEDADRALTGGTGTPLTQAGRLERIGTLRQLAGQVPGLVAQQAEAQQDLTQVDDALAAVVPTPCPGLPSRADRPREWRLAKIAAVAKQLEHLRGVPWAHPVGNAAWADHAAQLDAVLAPAAPGKRQPLDFAQRLAAVTALALNVDFLTSRVAELSDQIVTSQLERNDVKRRLEDVQQERDTAVANFRQTQGARNALEQEVAGLREKLAVAAQSKAACAPHVEALCNEHEALARALQGVPVDSPSMLVLQVQKLVRAHAELAERMAQVLDAANPQ